MGRPLGSVNKDKRFKAALVRYVDADPKRLDEMVEKLWLTAMDGDVSAMREVFDRLDGKVPQAIGGTDELEPIMHTFGWKPNEPKSATESKSVGSVPRQSDAGAE